MLALTMAKSTPDLRKRVYGGEVAKMVPSPAFTTRFNVSCSLDDCLEEYQLGVATTKDLST